MSTPAHDVYGSPPHSAWRTVEWKRHLRRILVDGSAVNLVDVGEGPALIFVHGLGGSWQNWLENIPFFTDRYRVVAPDLPGFGNSQLPRERISIRSYGRTLSTLCDELGIETAAVVGNSMGGFVGAELAIQSPERVERLVLVSAAALWREERVARPLVTLGKLTEAGAAVAVAQWERGFRRPRVRNAILWGAGIERPGRLSRELTYELFAGGARRDGFQAALQALYDYDIRDRLPEIRCPTLVIWGERDRLVPARHAEEYRKLIPDARVEVFERTGHVAMLERPGRFNRVVDEFLAQDAELQAARGTGDVAAA